MLDITGPGFKILNGMHLVMKPMLRPCSMQGGCSYRAPQNQHKSHTKQTHALTLNDHLPMLDKICKKTFWDC